MGVSKRYLKLGLMVILSVLGSALPFLLVAPVIRVAHKNFSSGAFWTSYLLGVLILVGFGLIPVAISLLSVTLLMGLFSEIYKRYRNMFAAGFPAVAVSAAVTVSATQQWLISKGTTLALRLQEQVQIVLKQAQQVNSMVKIEPEYLLGQVPSVLAALLIMSLALALILETPISRLFGFATESEDKLHLLDFKLPDSYIWIAMVSFLFSFIDIGNKSVSMAATNVVNVMVVLYFFQGLAVVEAFFAALRVGFFVRFLTYAVFLVQLFFLVAAIGVIDFWVEFRRRFLRLRLNH
ncbi:MAG: hypothetical protein RJB66_2344 [Pseudomonadota bacterium]